MVGSIPIARTEKHVVLSTTSPAKPTTSTVKAKNNQNDEKPEELVDATRPKRSSQVKLDLGDDARGAIHITLNYDPGAGILNVKLIEVSRS